MSNNNNNHYNGDGDDGEDDGDEGNTTSLRRNKILDDMFLYMVL